jgi:hypothetical protein
MSATLTVPILGTRAERIQQEKSDEEITLPLRPLSVSLERNDHNQADSCSLTVDWTDAGVDPRLLDDGVLSVYIGEADALGNWTPGRKDLRFVGILEEPDAERATDQAGRVTLDAIDYTTLFLTAKPFGSAGIPDYSQSLADAWRRIVSQTPGAEALEDALVFEGGTSPHDKLGAAVADRFRSLGKVSTNRETDAWAVWQQCVGMLGLISWVREDQVVVSTATNLYTEIDPPVMIWGKNIEFWRESRSGREARKGIGVTSFSPLTGTSLEAYYPPVGDPRVKRKAAAAKKGNAAAVRQAEERAWFAVPFITEQEILERYARRIWEERHRQELEGEIKTAEMRVERHFGDMFDLLTLKSGDAIKVQVDPESRQLLDRIETPEGQVAHLMRRGYSRQTATLIIKNYQEFSSLEPVHYVKTVRVDMSVDPDGGSFGISVNYVNRIQVTE